jgi:apolipoprotein D and lipocalin family protein
MFSKKLMPYVLCCLFLILSGCVGIPEGIRPVENFQLDRYLGQWHEIARLDHSFERGLSKITADYSLREDGGINVVNRGFSAKNNAWQEALGKAYFVNNTDEGHLKVSFFGPFYGSYIVFELDTVGYQYAFISGPNKDYLWLLARTPAVESEIIKAFVSKSKALGFDISKLIFVKQN